MRRVALVLVCWLLLSFQATGVRAARSYDTPLYSVDQVVDGMSYDTLAWRDRIVRFSGRIVGLVTYPNHTYVEWLGRTDGAMLVYVVVRVDRSVYMKDHAHVVLAGPVHIGAGAGEFVRATGPTRIYTVGLAHTLPCNGFPYCYSGTLESAPQ